MFGITKLEHRVEELTALLNRQRDRSDELAGHLERQRNLLRSYDKKFGLLCKELGLKYQEEKTTPPKFVKESRDEHP